MSQGVNTWIKTDSAMRTNSVWAQQHVCQCSLEKLFNHSHTIHEQICFVKMHMARYLLELTENPALSKSHLLGIRTCIHDSKLIFLRN